MILEGVATLSEIECHYSIDDVADRNDALDAWHEAKHRAEARAARDAQAKAQGSR